MTTTADLGPLGTLPTPRGSAPARRSTDRPASAPSAAAPDVTVIIPVYNAGERIERPIASLRAQTLGERLEVVFVDDGSTDDTPRRLESLVLEDRRFRLERIPNSGWPSRPRNRGIELARGRYVVFLDHDDELGSESALLEAVTFADLHRADVVVGKEVSVGGAVLNSDMWRSDVADADLLDDGCLDLLTVHRMFRTSLLREHGIRFPERKGLLEDHPFALHAYLAAQRISVLASRPFYRWIVEGWGGGNNSMRQIAMDAYFGNIEDSLDLITRYMAPGERHDRVYVRWLAVSLATSVGPRLFRQSAEYQEEWLRRARRLVEERYDSRFDAMLSPARRLRIQLLRAGDLAGLRSLAAWEDGIGSRPATMSVTWQDGALTFQTRTVLLRRDEPVRFERRGDRIVWPLPEELRDRVPGGALDVTDDLGQASAELKIRSRDSRVEWYVPTTSRWELVEDAQGLTLQVTCESRLDPRTVAVGAPLESGVWDVRMRLRALGYDSQPRLRGAGVPAGAALLDGTPHVLYRTVDETLALDIGQNHRSVVSNAHPRACHLTAASGRVTLELPRLEVCSAARMPATLELLPLTEDGRPVPGAEPLGWAAELDAPRSGSARLTARGEAAPGRYAVIVDVAGRRARLHLELHVPAHGAPWAVAPGAAAVPVVAARSLPARLRRRVRNRLRRAAPAVRAVAG